jgi:hypothetical protein
VRSVAGDVVEGSGCDCCLMEAAKIVAESKAASMLMVISSSSRSLRTSWKEGNDTVCLRKVLRWTYPLFGPRRRLRTRVQFDTDSSRSLRALAMPFILWQ